MGRPQVMAGAADRAAMIAPRTFAFADGFAEVRLSAGNLSVGDHA